MIVWPHMRARWPHSTPLLAQVGPWVAAIALLGSCGPKAPPAPVVERTAEVSVALPTPPVADERLAGPGEVVVRVQARSATALELTCLDGHRDRVTLGLDAGRTWAWGRFRGLSATECDIHFKGGAPARWRSVQPGSSLTCDVVGTTALCGDLEAARSAAISIPEPEEGVLLVQLRESKGATSVEVLCPGDRKWVPLKAGQARVEGMPNDRCRMTFQGPNPATVPDVRAGQVLTCTITSAGAACTEVGRTVPVALREDAPKVSVPPDAVWVELAPDMLVNAVELSCSDGTRLRQRPTAEHQARFRPVTSSDCEIFVKGSAMSRYKPVSAGQALACAYIGTILTCTDLAAP